MTYKEMVKLTYEDIVCGFEKEALFKAKEDSKDKILKKSYSANVRDWGKSPDNNTLYITGYSGSGKSTVARKIGEKNTNIIHLDPYFEDMSKSVASSIQDKEFNNYIKNSYPEYTEIANPNKYKRHSKEWWKVVDNFQKQIEDFSRKQHSGGKRVIVEGVQLNDETMYPNKDYFKSKPILITHTGPITSFYRARKRDGLNISDRDKSLKEKIKRYKEYVKWYGDTYSRLKELKNMVSAKKGMDINESRSRR